MIKRVRFGSRCAEVDRPAFEAAWRAEAHRALECPEGLRPARVALCLALVDVVAPQRHEAVVLEWFGDPEHLAGYVEWSAAGAPTGTGALGAVIELVADEVVLRGEEWLRRRWEEGGERLKHMAVAKRAPGLSAAAFSARWRRRAGSVGTSGEVVVIPDEARGRAYVQNHPLPGSAEPAYDAFNEVYLDDMEELRARMAWFDRTLGQGTEEDLLAEHAFLVAREEVVLAAGARTGPGTRSDPGYVMPDR